MVDEAEKAKHVIAIRAVFESLERSLLAIPETENAVVNLDANKALGVGRAVAKNLAPVRSRFERPASTRSGRPRGSSAGGVRIAELRGASSGRNLVVIEGS